MSISRAKALIPSVYLYSNYREVIDQKKSALLLQSSSCHIRIKKFIIKRPDFCYYDLCSRTAHVKGDMIRRTGCCYYDLFSLTVRTESIIKQWHISFIRGATAPSGPGPPHYRGFVITLRHSTFDRTSSGRVIILKKRPLHGDTHKTGIHAPGRIRINNSSKRATAYWCVRPPGHRVHFKITMVILVYTRQVIPLHLLKAQS